MTTKDPGDNSEFQSLENGTTGNVRVDNEAPAVESILTVSDGSPETHPPPHDNITITKLTQRISSLEESNIALHNYINELNIRLPKPEDGGYERGGAAFDKLNNFTQKTEEYGRLIGDLSKSAQDLEKQISTLTTSVSDTSHVDKRFKDLEHKIKQQTKDYLTLAKDGKQLTDMEQNLFRLEDKINNLKEDMNTALVIGDDNVVEQSDNNFTLNIRLKWSPNGCSFRILHLADKRKIPD